jgi:hypothetical protein
MNTWVEPGHFYSPLVDPNDEHVARTLDNFETAELPSDDSLVLDDEVILAMLDRLGSFQSEMPFQNEKVPELRYYFENGVFEQGDGAVYYGIL